MDIDEIELKTCCSAVMSLLLTPGPLTTSWTVKRAAFRDMGSRDHRFKEITKSIRERLLKVAQVDANKYTIVLIPGSGTMGVEAVINSFIGPDDKLLVVSNGAYGERIEKICLQAGLMHETVSVAWDRAVVVDDLVDKLDSVTAVAMVHSETTSGLLNPIEEVGRILKERGITFIVDAMSSFGGIPIDIETTGIDFLVSSANKCVQGIPGFSWVLADRAKVERARYSRSYSLDLYDQWQRLETAQEFRFTPPVQAILAFNQALTELQQEGIKTRYNRYRRNQQVVSKGLQEAGFELYLDPKIQGPIITTFMMPPNFDFGKFYMYLCKEGYVIYSGKLTREDTFRVASIGHLYEGDMLRFVEIVKEFKKTNIDSNERAGISS